VNVRAAGRRPRGPLRLAVGLGDPERERRILPILEESGEVRIVERCLSANQLLVLSGSGRVDALLYAFDLHRLTSSMLAELDTVPLPQVLLVPQTEDSRWQGLHCVRLGVGAGADLVAQALTAAVRGERLSLPEAGPPAAHTSPALDEPPPPSPQGPPDGTGLLSVISIASGSGSPGRSTVAVNLAAALGTVAPTILVDVDLAGPSIAAQLDADPTRNLYMVAHAEPDAPWEWERAISAEVQRLDRRIPYAVVLCGVPKPDMRTRITRGFLERLVSSLQRRYQYVILDTGAEVLSIDGAVHRAAHALADQVLLVCSADLVGMSRARAMLGLLASHLQINAERVALVVNQHDPRYHHTRTEIEWALSVGVGAVVPFDRNGIQRALAAQRPTIVVDDRGAAGRSLLDLAERLHAGKLVLPAEPAADTRPRWLRVLPTGLLGRRTDPTRNGPRRPQAEEATHDDVVAS
jgi:MinD-like ATPase involved in chromosome partitioning or flagellar assembly